MNQRNLTYECLIKNHIKHVLNDYERQSTDDEAQSQLWCLTLTFPTKAEKGIPIDHCFARVEKWYVRMFQG